MRIINETKTDILKDTLELKLKEINSLLREKYLQEKNVGVLEGLSGIALFQFYYAKYSNNDTIADWGQDTLLKIIKTINQGYNIPTLSSGLAGAGWVIDHLNTQGFIETDSDELLNPLDEYLLSVMKENIDRGNYDFLHGAMGYAFHFIERYKATQNKKLKQNYITNIKCFIDGLLKTAEQDINGLKWLSKINSAGNRKDAYNLSLSHGMSSIISFISELVKYDVFKGECINLLQKSVNYVISHELSKDRKSTSLFPNWILENDISDQNSRLAWCYGDLGIGLACLKASKVLKNEDLKRKALFILEQTTFRKAKKDTLVIDAAICHGAFGNAQIYNFLYIETKNELYNDSARYWIQYGMKMSIHDDGYAGYKQWGGNSEEWSPKTSLLEGIAGIGLSIIDYLSEEPNTWDKCLLIG